KAVERTQPICPGTRETLLEPADGGSADSREHNPRLPRFAKNFRNAPLAPDRQHALRVPAADVNHILAQQIRPKIRRPFEEWEMRWPTAEFQKRRVETYEII